VLADMSRRVCSSSSERTGAGKMRFFACVARVVENSLVAFLVVDARSILEAKEMDFMLGDRVIPRYCRSDGKQNVYFCSKGGCLRVSAAEINDGNGNQALGASMRSQRAMTSASSE
jgi:hypothetical protein